MKIFGRCFLLLILTACLTRGGFEDRIKTWVGHPAAELFTDWGPPTETFDLPDGRKMYTWANSRGAQGTVVGSTVYATQIGCRITFTVGTSGLVEAWRYEGNNCY